MLIFCFSLGPVLLHIYLQMLRTRLDCKRFELVFSDLPVKSKGLGRVGVSHNSGPGYVAGVAGMALATGPSCRYDDCWGDKGSI